MLQKKQDGNNTSNTKGKERRQEKLLQLRTLTMQGYKNEEIAEMMHYTINYIYTLIKIAMQEDIWFSKEEILEFRRKRFEKKAIEDFIEHDQKKEIDAEDSTIDDTEKKKRKNLRRYTEEYRRLRRMAKEEDNWEIKGADSVSLKGRTEFAAYLMKLYQLEADIPRKDIEIILNAISVHPEFANKERLKLVILSVMRSEGIDQAEKISVTLLRELENTPFREPLWQYRKWIQRQKLIPQIMEMKEMGLSNTEIGEKLGITSAEVMVFLEKSKNQPEFFEDEGR